MIIKFLGAITYLTGIFASENCLEGIGYSWCEDTQSCVRQWITPCADNYDDCHDCLKRQRKGENIACPEDCSNSHQYRPTEPCQIPYEDCSSTFVCPKITEVTHCSVDGIDGYITYQISLIVKDSHIKNIYAIFGSDNSGNSMMNIPPAYQTDGIFGSNIGGVSPEIIMINPNSRYDSWLTIGITDGDPDNKLANIGIPFNEWNEETGMMIDNGAIFLMNPQEIITTEKEYIIGQMTIPSTPHDVIVNVQGELDCDGCSNNRWTEKGIQFHLNPSLINTIPPTCKLWYDGCNTCSVNNGIRGICTKTMCFREGNPHCLDYNTPGH